MKKILIGILAVVASACQQPQRYFTASPEIDLAKKADEAYYKGDWAGLRALYADTAKINVNVWTGGEVTVDQFIEMLKSGVANYSEYKQGEGAVYEMVVTDEGNKFTHSWQQWIGKHKNGKEVRTVVNISGLVAGGKIAWAGLIYDSHPGFMAEQPSDSTVMK